MLSAVPITQYTVSTRPWLLLLFCSYQVVDLVNFNKGCSPGVGEKVSLPQRGAGNEIAWEIRIVGTPKHPQGLFPAAPP